eukprot:GEZU01001359.1.p2 GENE.GEZU01001359.1~~GEZU01001359.1.p2  ORF type:complete len:184 (+),score=35.30 GEZU01001359.1:1032-1583(+)
MYTLSAITVWNLLMSANDNANDNDGEAATTQSPQHSSASTTTTPTTNESFSHHPGTSTTNPSSSSASASASSCSVRRWTPLFCAKLAICVVYSLILIQKAFQTVGSGHHYSVDIIIAFYLTILVWFTPFASKHCTAPVLSASQRLHGTDYGEEALLDLESLSEEGAAYKLEEGRLRRRPTTLS